MPAETQSPPPTVLVATMVLGLTQTNTYIVAEGASGQAVVIDPAADGEQIAARIAEKGWDLTAVWLTHAHFDHIGGLPGLAHSHPSLPVALHPADKPLLKVGGGAALFGLPGFKPGLQPTLDLQHGMTLQLGEVRFEVRHTPGHTPGHVVFVCQAEGLVFCGDLVFMGSVGRTDLPGGSWKALQESIRQEILPLPDETHLLSGHGPATTVGREKRTNPFLLDLL
jgi:hydroxyacylglutathione hydrolase